MLTCNLSVFLFIFWLNDLFIIDCEKIICSYYSSIYFLNVLFTFALYIYMLYVGCRNIFKCYVLLMNWLLYHYKMTFFAFWYSLWLTDYFVSVGIATPTFFWFIIKVCLSLSYSFWLVIMWIFSHLTDM